MSRNKCFFQVQISHFSHFISISDLLHDSTFYNVHAVDKSVQNITMNRRNDSSVCIVTGSSSISGRGLLHKVQTSAQVQPISNGYRGLSLCARVRVGGVKQPECEADYSPPSSPEVMNGAAVHPHPPPL
jgi:hypothetical protein